MIEAAGVEECLEPGALCPGELLELTPARGYLLGARLQGGPRRELAPVVRGQPLQVDQVCNPLVGILGLEVHGRLEAVPEAIDVGGIGIHVLPERARVLREQAQRLGIVGGLQSTGCCEALRVLLAAGLAGRVLGLRAHDHGLQDCVQPLIGPMGLVVHGCST